MSKRRPQTPTPLTTQDSGAELERARAGRVVLRVRMHPHGRGAQRQGRGRLLPMHFGQLR